MNPSNLCLAWILALGGATVLAAPAAPQTNGTLMSLVNLKPEGHKTLKNSTYALQTSKAAVSPEVSVGTESSADLNLQNNVLISLIRKILSRLAPERPTAPPQPVPVVPNFGNGNFQPAAPGPAFFNPFSLFGGNMFFPGFMSDMFENFW